LSRRLSYRRQIISAKDKISERSLEFNTVYEILESIRGVYRNTYVVGYTTRQEAYHGLDISIDIPGYMLMAYQFKAPIKKYLENNVDVYRFRVGDTCARCTNPRLKKSTYQVRRMLNKYGLPRSCANQHVILYAMATIIKHKMNIDVYYVFPLIYSYRELESHVPGILDYTILIRVLDFPLSTVIDCRSHRVEIHLPRISSYNISVVFYSKPKEFPKDKVFIASKVIKKKIGEFKMKDILTKERSFHFSPSEVKEILLSDFYKKAEREDISLSKIKKLVDALVSMEFSYRGLLINIGK